MHAARLIYYFRYLFFSKYESGARTALCSSRRVQLTISLARRNRIDLHFPFRRIVVIKRHERMLCSFVCYVTRNSVTFSTFLFEKYFLGQQ